jgi:hypothetical protein
MITRISVARFAHAKERRLRYVMIAGRGCRARSAAILSSDSAGRQGRRCRTRVIVMGVVRVRSPVAQLTRWDAELRAKHAAVAATAVTEPVFAQPAPATAAAHQAGSLAYAGVAGPRGR